MTTLDQTTFNKLTHLLTPLLMDEAARRACLRLALPDPLYQRIDFTGPAHSFTVQMLATLLQYGEVEPGKSALVAVLDTLHPQVGVDKQHTIDQLRRQLQHHLQMGPDAQAAAMRQGATTGPIEPHAQGIVFAGNQAVTVMGDVINAAQVNKPTYIDLGGAAVSIERWLNRTFAPSAIPAHLANSWAGRFIYINRTLTADLHLDQIWTLLIWLTLWVATNWLVTPILQWPLDDTVVRGRAALLYTLATLLMPFFVALVSPVDRQDEMELTRREARLRFWYLKLIGACTGYSLIAGAVIIALFVHYLGASLPRPIQWALTLVPLLFSHIGARRIPGDRLKMYGEVRLHEVDRLVVLVWLLLGPGTAAAIYLGYEAIANPGMGLLLLIGGSAALLWERQKSANPGTVAGRRWLDYTRITLFGLLLPAIFVVLIFSFTLPSAWPTQRDWWVLLLTTPYILGLSLLVATIFVRNPPNLTIRGMVGILIAVWGIGYALYLDLRLGSGLALLLLLLWIGWGRRRWRRYLWIHPSFGVAWVVIGGVIYLWLEQIVLPWMILVGWIMVIAGLITWAFQVPSASSKPDTRDEDRKSI